MIMAFCALSSAVKCKARKRILQTQFALAAIKFKKCHVENT